jgi:hypothetical protein
MFAKLFSPARKSSLTTRRKNRLTRRSQFECLERRELMTASPFDISASQLAAVSVKASALTGPAVSITALSPTYPVTILKAPAAPSFKTTVYSASQINLSWSTVSGATSYLVDEMIKGVWQQIASIGSGGTSFSVTGLTAYTTYDFDVAAENKLGTTWANCQSVTTAVAMSHPTSATAYSVVNGTLFGPGGPSYLDVAQGAAGDCWLMASLAAVAARDPQDIQNMFAAAGSVTMNGVTDNVYTVRFFNNSGVAVYVTVDSALPSAGTYYDNVNNGVLWAALAEKAYAQANGMGLVTTSNSYGDSYAALNGGDAAWALRAITGKSASDYGINPTNAAAAWNAGEFVVLCTSTPVNAKIVGDHCYAMVNYTASSTMPFEVYNPWGISTSTEFGFYGLFNANAAFLSQNFTEQSIGTGAAAGMDGLSNGSQKVHTLNAIDQVMAAFDTWAFA